MAQPRICCHSGTDCLCVVMEFSVLVLPSAAIGVTGLVGRGVARLLGGSRGPHDPPDDWRARSDQRRSPSRAREAAVGCGFERRDEIGNAAGKNVARNR